MLKFTVDEDRCTFCKSCIEDCPAGIIESGGNVPVIHESGEVRCIQCQHCLAVCPQGAISILGKYPEDSVPSDLAASADATEALIRTRRTVRRFTREPVDPHKITRMIYAAANAPTGKNARKVHLILFDNIQSMRKIKEIIISRIEQTEESADLTGKERTYLKMAKLYRRGNDIIFRGAPHLVFASVPEDVPTPVADGMIALTYMELMAASLNVGTVWAGFIMHILEHFPDLQGTIGIPAAHKVAFALLFGNPAVRYARGVQRDDITVVRPDLNS